jgi:hypothetical protein
MAPILAQRGKTGKDVPGGTPLGALLPESGFDHVNALQMDQAL